MAPRKICGQSASDGFAAGRAVWRGSRRPGAVSGLSGAAAQLALEAAIAAAIDGITGLMAEAANDAADILAFQVAMLEDDALREPAVAAIDSGTAADTAWQAALDAEIAGYEASDDEYFRARAADLRDIRDRVLWALSGNDREAISPGSILAAEDLPPSLFLETDWSQGGGIVLEKGSVTSHVAMLARARGIPMLVGLGTLADIDGKSVLLDGHDGQLTIEPSSSQEAAFGVRVETQHNAQKGEDAFLHLPARLKDGSSVQVLINVAGPEDVENLEPLCCDGIGLMRSEFLFRDGSALPGEDEQYGAYRRLVEWADGRPVTIRTLDIGGDKPVRGLTAPDESNPFLGLRGVRLTLQRQDVFRTQLRALLRAAVHGQLKIMIPMVTVPRELAETSALIETCFNELHEAGVAARRPDLGIMVEVPAVAIAPELFDTADFFSIGSNDLTQYVTASSRDDHLVADLADPSHPAVVKLIADVAAHGLKTDKPVSLCGDMASDVRHLPALMAAGLRSISVAPARLARIKAALRDI